ncbi:MULTISPECIES: NAD(P)/FAD-dependent oxidoreductase [unclassified Pseudomonas]|uniref:NAD(P)/FAD-dependent oxidoreductase n=1 Tax=unclassified Pseudomonas TaxID=196821 RepID=UPI00091DF324|nr:MULTISPECIES: FAD-binding oxidoreductase [unclassified Pseudomonas]ROO31539.1 FAD-dependent oxidoreductase [Pseudomonas sp. 7SR1]SFX57068.1 sarcosine oxidase [Pseudomonas sp. NFACC36]SIS26737.1 sarcosine oxidase [Pseudomonas sp. 7SR1]
MNAPFAPQLPASLWAATAAPAVQTPALAEDKQVDIAIVGAGYTGLVTALRLAEAGVDVCVLDAGEPGWGASGRNGGQVIPGLKFDPDQLHAKFGAARAEAMLDVAGCAADEVFSLVRRYAIDCDATQKGWIQPACSSAAMKVIEQRAGQWQRRGVQVELLDRTAVSQRIGTDNYLGGWVDPRAGSLHPLSYARGLAKAALGQGAMIHGHSRVTRLQRQPSGWTLSTVQGARVSAQRVLLATDGYTDDLWPGLRQTVVAANSFIIATRPLPSAIRKSILPGGEVCSDSRRLLLYFKLDAQGRLLLGGRGPFSEPSQPRDWAHLERSLAALFPQAAQVPVEYRWSGRVALTQSFLPHVHEPAPGLCVLLGYNGRGIALSTALGKHLAAKLSGATQAFPFPVMPLRRIPFHGLQRLYLAAGIGYYRLLDALF